MTVRPIDPTADEPPFEQLRRQLAARATSGDLAPGTRLPTVRALAEQLGVSAGTVARAYRELESDGVVVTEGRRGTFVASAARASSADAERAAGEYVATLRRLGLGVADAVRLVEREWAR